MSSWPTVRTATSDGRDVPRDPVGGYRRAVVAAVRRAADEDLDGDRSMAAEKRRGSGRLPLLEDLAHDRSSMLSFRKCVAQLMHGS